MSAQGSITLNTHVYAPAGSSNGIATWVDRSGDFGQAFSKLTESVRGPSTDGSFRILFKLDTPKVAAVDTTCSCAGTTLGTAVGSFDIKIPNVFTTTDRTDFYLRCKALIEHAIFSDAVEDLTGSW